MLCTDGRSQFVMSRDGYHVGQLFRGDGTFGDWSFAQVLQQGSTFAAIEYERSLTSTEISALLNNPIMYWFVLTKPVINPAHNTWALMVCRFDQYSSASRQIITPRHHINTAQKIGV